MRHSILTAFALAVGFLAGCSGTLVSKPFDDTQVVVGKPLEGIPFSLNRPKLLVTRTPAVEGKPEAYVVSTSWEPDPLARYTLQLRPGLFSSVDWTMTFDANGALTDTNAKVTDQSASIVQAVGSLVIAGAALLQLTADPPALGVNCDDQYPSKDMPQIVALRSRVNREITGRGRIWDVASAQWKSIAREEQARRARESDSFWNDRVRLASCTGQLGTFTYADLGELALILTAVESFKELPNTNTTEVDATITGLPKEAEEERAVAFQLRRALLAYDVTAVQTIKANVIKTRAALNAERQGNLDADIDNKLEAVDREVELASTVATKGFPKAFLFAVKLSSVKPADWRTSRLASLDKEIAQLALLSGTPANAGQGGVYPAPPGVIDIRLAKLREQRAQILGVLPEFRRRTELHDRLVTGSPQEKSKAATAGMPAEKAKATLAEIDYLDKRVAAAEATVVLSKTTPKADDPVPASYLVSNCQLDDTQIKARLDARRPSVGARPLRPEYVVVFNPVQAKSTNACDGVE
jgi:hypothetical protein